MQCASARWARSARRCTKSAVSIAAACKVFPQRGTASRPEKVEEKKGTAGSCTPPFHYCLFFEVDRDNRCRKPVRSACGCRLRFKIGALLRGGADNVSRAPQGQKGLQLFRIEVLGTDDFGGQKLEFLALVRVRVKQRVAALAEQGLLNRKVSAHVRHQTVQNAREGVFLWVAAFGQAVGQFVALREHLLVLAIQRGVAGGEMGNPLRTFGHA